MDAAMTPERWHQVKELLADLLTMDAAGRRRVLDGLSDAALREELETLLGADPRLVDDVLPPAAGETTDTGERPPEVLDGRYRIQRALGRGGMGTVHLAHDLKLDCPVAIKRLKDLWLPDGEARRRLRHEGRALAALNHPHIARVNDVLDSEPPALVMEYVEGRQLSAWATEADRTSAEVLTVLRQVVEAVAYTHRKGVVHCDLKPANVIVTPEGVAKVVDFGIALVARASTTTVMTDTTRPAAFTPKYAAPEVKRGATPTPASDVYCLGRLIEEVLGDRRRLGQTITRQDDVVWSAVAARATAVESADRFRDGVEMLAAVPGEKSDAPAWSYSPRRALPALLAVGMMVSGGLSSLGDGYGVSANALGAKPVLAVVTRVDDASAHTTSAAAADILRRALGPLTRARLVSDVVPPLKAGRTELVNDLRFEGLTHVLIPTVASTTKGVKLTVALCRAEDLRVVRTTTRTGSADALESLAGSVVAELRSWLGEAPTQPAAALLPLSRRSTAEYSEAQRYLQRPDRPNALVLAREHLESVVRRDSHYAPAHAALARTLVQLYGQRSDASLLVRARNAADRAIALQPGLPESHLALAAVYAATSRREEASAELTKVLAIDPMHEQALRLLGQNEAERGRVDEAVAILKKLVASYESWPNYRTLGTVLFRDGQYRQAVEQFTELTSLQPDNPWGHQQLGAAWQQLGDTDKALRAYETSLALLPRASTLTNVGTIHFGRGEMTEAVAAYRKAIELAPHDPVMHRNLGDAYGKMHQTALAAEAYVAALRAAEATLTVKPDELDGLGTAVYAGGRLQRCDAVSTYAVRVDVPATRDVALLSNLLNAGVLCHDDALVARIVGRLSRLGHRVDQLLEDDVKGIYHGGTRRPPR